MLSFKRKENKVKIDFGLKDICKYYQEHSRDPIEKSLIGRILREYNTEILRMMIYDGLDYSMSHRIGSFRIKKFDNSLKLNDEGEIANKLRPDWAKTKEKWAELYKGASAEEIKKIPDKPIIYHLNNHTDGYVFRWYWDKVTSNIKNQSVYKFAPIRQMKREAAQAWKKHPELRTLYYE